MQQIGKNAEVPINLGYIIHPNGRKECKSVVQESMQDWYAVMGDLTRR